MITTSPLTPIAELLAEKLNRGSAARETMGDSNVAFGWSENLPPILARFIESAKIDGLSFTGTRVQPSATPVVKVPEAGQKPEAILLSTFQIALPKYSGMAIISLEQTLSVTALLPAIHSSLVGQALVAYDRDSIAQLALDRGSEATGENWTSAILNGVAEVAGAGQSPDLLVLAPSDYASAVQDPAAVFSADPSTGVTALLGLRLAVCVGAVAGTGYVLDSRAVVAAENVSSPLILADPYGLADTNRARIIVDLVAATVVTQPAGVCELTVTPPVTQGTSRDDYALGA